VARRGTRFSALLTAAIVAATTATGAPPSLPAAQKVDEGALRSVEGRLDVSYRGPDDDGAVEADRTITFRFTKPFRLYVVEQPSGLQISLDLEQGRIYDPRQQRLVTLDVAEIMQHRWMRFLVAMLDFNSLVDPQQMPQLRKNFSLELHRGAPPSDRHTTSWRPAPPAGEHAGPGDWFVLTPGEASVYRTVLGLGRVVLLVGPRLGIPTEFRYYRRDGDTFERTVTVRIDELAYNRTRPDADYLVVVPAAIHASAAVGARQTLPEKIPILGGSKALMPAMVDGRMFAGSIFVGLIAGLITGVIGAGGGYILTPALMSFGVRGIMAVGTDQFHLFAKAIMGTTIHRKMGNVNTALAAWFVGGSLGGVTLGGKVNRAIFQYSPALSDAVISVVYVVVLGLLGIYAAADFLRMRRTRGSDAAQATTGVDRWLQYIPRRPRVSFEKNVIPGGR